ncbi:MAG: hypothetical protein U1F10_14330 [Burkholderiales bacterium]
MAPTIYVADPDPAERQWIAAALAPTNAPVRTFDSAGALLGLLHSDDDACLIVAVEPDEAAAVALVQELRDLGIAIPVIALGPGTAFRTARDLARFAHTDYLERPTSAGRLVAAVRRARGG